MNPAILLASGLWLSLFGGSEQTARTVDELPLDRFDEYMEGSLPPHPWIAVGAPSEGVSLALRKEAETPFCGNRVTGKALVLSDSSETAGEGVGIANEFRAPPEGEVYLGFDFNFDASDLKKTLDFSARLSGKDGENGLVLHLGQNGKIVAESASGDIIELCSVLPKRWYHIGATIQPDGKTSLKLYDFSKIIPNAKPDDDMRNIGTRMTGKGVELPSVQIKLPKRFERLEFVSAGPNERTGSWTLDNVCMAGKVDAPREAMLPFKQLPVEELRKSPKKVFAYYFIFSSGYTDEDPGLGWYTRTVLNPSGNYHKDRVEAGTESLFRPLPRPPMQAGLDKDEVRIRGMEEELRVLRNLGMDGFLVDFWADPHPSNGQSYFSKNSFAILDAVQRVDKTMKVIPAIYCNTKKGGVDGEADEDTDPIAYANSPVMEKILTHPSVYRLPDGRVLMSQWLTEKHSVAWWTKAMAELARKGTPVALLPQFNSYGKVADFAPISYGLAHWGPRTPCAYDWAKRVQAFKDVKCVFPIVEQDVRTRGCTLWEAQNSETLRKLWTLAIDGGADWALLDTWNDYSEQAMAPSTCLGYATSDLNAYYTQWLKTGKQPEIVRDTLYYFHRKNHSEVEQLKGAKWSFRGEGAAKGNDNAERDMIELLAFLKEPGTLKIDVAGKSYEMEAKAGITSFKVPLPKGEKFVPVFTLSRDGKAVISGASRFAVLDKVEYPNMLYCSGVIPSAE